MRVIVMNVLINKKFKKKKIQFNFLKLENKIKNIKVNKEVKVNNLLVYIVKKKILLNFILKMVFVNFAVEIKPKNDTLFIIKYIFFIQ